MPTAVEWDSSEVKVILTPVGKPAGRKPQEVTVFGAYGTTRERVVQAIAGMLDGTTVYFESILKTTGEVTHVIPLAGWRGSLSGESLTVLAEFIGRVVSNEKMELLCYGAARARWKLDIKTSSSTIRDALDNMSDSVSDRGSASGDNMYVEPNGIRSQF